MVIDANAPILPSAELGGVIVGSPLRDYNDLLLPLAHTGKIGFSLRSMFEASYRLASGTVEIVVDVRNGKVFRITAHSGYHGKLFGAIHVGMPVAAAMEIEPALYYDEAEELIFCRDVPGVSLDVSEIDPPPERVKELEIIAISVFAPVIETSAGQRGDW